ncbi:Concanavalin A-like lectin/glucanase, subgroup [Artemisia annua]|uniref:non-specific serine/threonine protein kinase n=1 Tax=Artemisia annua TaxID=35608 RepID=A0A2U1MV33_ARTAN|nr:Concanavalin A-like lectin/glucanase, subgroup [Artemisia annua]
MAEYKIAVGTARGLHYLHKVCPRRIIHRDIKASNVLVTKDFEPRISDFRLAKWLPSQSTHHSIAPIEGTFGHLAPQIRRKPLIPTDFRQKRMSLKTCQAAEEHERAAEERERAARATQEAEEERVRAAEERRNELEKQFNEFANMVKLNAKRVTFATFRLLFVNII